MKKHTYEIAKEELTKLNDKHVEEIVAGEIIVPSTSVNNLLNASYFCVESRYKINTQSSITERQKERNNRDDQKSSFET